MKKMKLRITDRIPGGKSYERWKASRIFKEVGGYDWIYKCYRNKYFLGGNRITRQQILWLRENYLKDGFLDFGWLRLKEDDIQQDVVDEIFDLVIPYIDQYYNPQIALILGEGTYEMFDLKVEKGDIVIDAGANIGIFTVFAAKYRKAYVHAFEPIKRVAVMMQENLNLNEVEEVTVNVTGLSDMCRDGTPAYLAVRRGDWKDRSSISAL